MSDNAITQLINYVGEVSDGWEEMNSQVQDVQNAIEQALSDLDDIKSDLEDKVDCVVTTLEECANDIPSDEDNWNMVAEQVEEGLVELKKEWDEEQSDLIDGLKSDLLAEYKLFAGLCEYGYKVADFTELVERLFANVY